jgi:hypothetical protein
MADIELHSFTRLYRYKSKVEESPFFTRYVLNGESKLVGETEGRKETNGKGSSKKKEVV